MGEAAPDINVHDPASSSAGNAGPLPLGPDDKVSEFEKDVTELLIGLSKGGFGATPFGNSVTKIKDLIEKDMMVKVNQSHVTDQKNLDTLAAAVAACTTTKDSSLR